MCRIVEENIQALYADLANCYNAIPERVVHFGGPSIHFHLRALEEGRRDFLSDSHIEMIYAALTSWGMHRMGSDNGSQVKLINFMDFKHSILSFEDVFRSVSRYKLLTINGDELRNILDNKLKKVFVEMNLNVARSVLVTNAKTIHHILPDLIIPVDRNYISAFFFGQSIYRDKPEEDFELFKKIVIESKRIVNENNIFFEEKRGLIAAQNTVPFNSSIPKLLDNMIMAYMQNEKKKEEEKK